MITLILANLHRKSKLYHVKIKKPPHYCGGLCSHYLSSRRSDPSAACGRESEENEWQRSKKSRISVARRFFRVPQHNPPSITPVCNQEESLWDWCASVPICIKKESGKNLTLCVRITYLPGQSPAKYCRRT